MVFFPGRASTDVIVGDDVISSVEAIAGVRQQMITSEVKILFLKRNMDTEVSLSAVM